MVRVWVGGFGGAGRCVVEIRGEDECSGGERFSPLGVLLCGVPPGGWTLLKCVLGGVLLSRTLAGAVPSALSGLASGFGMGTGRFPVAVTTETTRWAVRDDRHLWCGYSVIRVAAYPTHWWCVWLVVGLGVDRIVDASLYCGCSPPGYSHAH